MILPDRLFEFQDRVFRIDEVEHDKEDNVVMITAECLTPQGNEGRWWQMDVDLDAPFETYTVQ